VNEQEKREVLRKILNWVQAEVSQGLDRTDTLQVEVHVKGKSVRPSLRLIYYS
jgi:hypothetical protein